MDKKIKILHLEDSLIDFELLHSIIKSGEIEHDYFLTDNEKDFKNILETENVDIILSDYSLPGYDGCEAFMFSREKYSSIPFIFVSGAIGEDAAINAMLNGATDYVLKNKLERLVPAIKRALNEHDLEIKRNQAEDRLRKSEQRVSEALDFNLKILNTSSIGILTYKKSGRCTYANEAAGKVTGASTKQLLAQNFHDIPSWKESGMHEAALKALNTCVPQLVEVQIETSFGKNVWLSLIFSSFNSEMEPHLLVFTSDITEKKQVELELIKAKEHAEESDRLKSAFLANMSHEIRTPMNGILGFTEFLKEPNLSSDDLQDYIQTIQISGSRMLNTINCIVDVAKIESGLIKVDIKETNINENIEFTYKFFKPEVEMKGLQFLVKKSLPANEAIIKTDNEKVYAILTNLVRNALKFTYEGSIEFGYEKKGGFLEFYVKDTGVGIPQNQRQIIFERFRQGSESHNRGYEGSGLGLSIAKSYVEMLGGEIWVESDEGKGSIFYFTIPYNAVSKEKNAIHKVFSEKINEVEIKKLKILIVEDDEISSSLLTRTLQKISHEILYAITGVQAIEACRNNPDLDLVLMDIRMPGMDGNEATGKIRKFNRDVIIIAQSAYGFPGDKEKALEAGCNDYITKPISKSLLIGLILRYFNK